LISKKIDCQKEKTKFLLFINKNIKMEQNVIKTIREAFKIAYANKMLKESSEDMARSMDPNELRQAETKYPSWVSGRLPLRWGATKLSDAAENYLVEKAVEEYKQSGDKKIQDALSLFYYPYEGSKVYNYLKKDNRLIGALRKRYGNSWEEAFDDVVLNAWTQSVGDVTKFEETIKKYVKDSAYGIGSVLLNDLKLELLRLGMKSSAVRRGGDSSMQSLDDPGFDSEGGRKFDLPGGVEMSSDEQMYEKMAEMIQEFGNQAADYFDSKGKETLSTLAREFFVNRKSYSEILRDNSEMFVGKKPGDLSTMMLLQVVGPQNIKSIADKLGPEYGFPKNWLENVMSSKNLNTIADLFKPIDTSMPDGDEEESDKEDDLIFEKFIQNNMDKIMKEVQRRISK
jgi:hypothetical protein